MSSTIEETPIADRVVNGFRVRVFANPNPPSVARVRELDRAIRKMAERIIAKDAGAKGRTKA